MTAISMTVIILIAVILFPRLEKRRIEDSKTTGSWQELRAWRDARTYSVTQDSGLPTWSSIQRRSASRGMRTSLPMRTTGTAFAATSW